MDGGFIKEVSKLRVQLGFLSIFLSVISKFKIKNTTRSPRNTVKNPRLKRYFLVLPMLVLNLFFYSSSVKANVLLKQPYSLLGGNEDKKLSLNMQTDNETSADGYVPYDHYGPRYIGTRILPSHEVIKFLAGGLLLVTGVVVGMIVALNSPSSSTQCSGDVCTSDSPTPGVLWGALLAGGTLGAAAGVTSSGYMLDEDGNFFITLAGSIALPFLLVFISDPSFSNIPPWAVEASFPAMLIGAMTAYDLSRTYSNKKGVSLLYYPLVSVSKDAGHHIDIAVNVLEMNF